MRRNASIAAAAALALCALLLGGCATASAAEPREAACFERVDDAAMAVDPGASGVAGTTQEREAESAQGTQEPQGQADAAEPVEAEPWGGGGPAGAYAPEAELAYTGDGFEQQGVREFGGRTETWYSSNAARHFRTDEWTVDGEGYYRDADGFYVVAASDLAQGETIETSKGAAKVYDSGCAGGVTDFYTAF